MPDNTKTGVTKACFYEPDLNLTYLDMARHYDTAVLPTRVRKPQDKAKVESAVPGRRAPDLGQVEKPDSFQPRRTQPADPRAAR